MGVAEGRVDKAPEHRQLAHATLSPPAQGWGNVACKKYRCLGAVSPPLLGADTVEVVVMGVDLLDLTVT